MIRLSMSLLVAVCALSGGPSALAQSAPSASAPTRPDDRQVSHAPPRPGDRACLRSTGSLIPAKPGQCLPVPGRSYSGEELRRTGATHTGDALRMLDPGIH